MAAISINRVGVIGMGKMGLPIARHLLAAGFQVTGCDVRDQSKKEAARLGVAVADSPAAVAAASDLVIVAVGFDSEANDVVFADDGILAGAAPGAVIAIASTIAPETMKRMVRGAGRDDVHFLDIPMCRGEQAAEDGTLLIMGGGDEGTFDTCRPAFETFADSIFHLGPVGAGQVGKMVNNLILWACISANHEGLKLAGALGVETAALRPALLNSSAQNWALQTGAADKPMPWAEKDMTIVLREADLARLSLPLCGSVKEVMKGIKIELGDEMPREPEA